MSASRLPAGGRIDRQRPLSFHFDGLRYEGFHGDTLASALLANDVHVLSRGIVTGSARGIMADGVEDPAALVTVDWPDGSSDPMCRATVVDLLTGLRGRSLQGKGRLSLATPPRHDKGYVHCDVLIVGGGPAGLAAALAAGRSGARVLVADDRREFGGTLLGTDDYIDGAPAMHWVKATVDRLETMAEVRLLTRATTIAYHDHQYVLIVQRCPTTRSARLWHVRAGQVVLATGAHERPIVFADNDRPGIMLASAVRSYLHRYGVRVGERAVVFTTNDSGLAAARDLSAAGAEVIVADARAGDVVTGTFGRERLDGVVVSGRRITCDLLAVSGGWSPVVHLFSQSRGTLRYDDALGAYVPDRPVQATHVAGAVAGSFRLGACLRQGAVAGAQAASAAGFDVDIEDTPSVIESTPDEDADQPNAPLWVVPPQSGTWHTHFIDLERDVTVADLHVAVDSGLQSIEHIKRFTTVGTGSDQGKTSWINTSAIAASLIGGAAGSIGLPTFRPPYVPVSFAVLAGRERGDLHDPVRTTAMHAWHVEHGAIFEDVGQWKRPRYFPRESESMDDAVLRESRTARSGVALMDVSTLGKIDLQGPDVGELLNRLYTNAFAKLPVGSSRYGMMCTLDGMVFDDGVTSRLAADRFLMTTTTGNAARVLQWIEEWLQTEWRELRVYATSVTEQWATMALVGPRSRDVLRALAPSFAVDNDSFPFMTWRAAEVNGIAARVFRISFSGELAYEINVPSWYGRATWEAVMTAGEPFGIAPYGTETMHVLRAEKGYPMIGQETDGTVTPHDLGMEWIVSKTKSFLGSRSHRRPDVIRPDRRQLVALLSNDPACLLPEGAAVVFDPAVSCPMPIAGHVTSSYRSAALGRPFALALVQGGRSRHGDTVFVPVAHMSVAATIASPALFDPEHRRRDG